MVFDPFIGWGDSNTKLAIINVLDKYGSLSAKKIHSRLKKDYGISVSYQATHKALKKMIDNNVLECEENNFRVSAQWVKKMKSFVSQLEKEHNDIKTVLKRLDAGKTVTFTVRNDMEMGYFVLDFGYYVSKLINEPLILNFFFMWTILPLSDEQFSMFKEIVDKNEVYVTARENSTYDQIMKRHWERTGAKVKIGVKDCVSNSEVVIMGDYIINIFWDQKHLDWNIEFTRTVKDEETMDYNKFYEVLGALTKTDFVIVKNKEAAEKIKQKVLSHFE